MSLNLTIKNDKIVNFFILIPVYNVEKYIDECLNSVLQQTYQNFTAIIVDDGTPDKAGEICDMYATQDNRIIVIHQSNSGLISARQTAIRYMLSLPRKGIEYVIFLDSDDTLKKDALEVLSKYIIKSSADMVIYGMNRVDNSMNIIEKISNQSELVISNKNKLYKIVLFNSSYNSLCRKAISKKLFCILDYSRYYGINHTEDLLQSIYFYKECQTIHFIKENLYNYRINPTSITHSINHDNFSVDFTVREQVMKFLVTEKIFSEIDYAEYRGYCAKLLVDKIVEICKFDISSKDKIKLVKKITETRYYKEYIKNKRVDYSKLGRKKYIYMLFKKKYYTILVTLITLITKLKR